MRKRVQVWRNLSSKRHKTLQKDFYCEKVEFNNLGIQKNRSKQFLEKESLLITAKGTNGKELVPNFFCSNSSFLYISK